MHRFMNSVDISFSSMPTASVMINQRFVTAERNELKNEYVMKKITTIEWIWIAMDQGDFVLIPFYSLRSVSAFTSSFYRSLTR